MFNIDPFIQKLNEKTLIINWLIDGKGIHNVPIRLASVITKEWLIENYNIEEYYFKKEIPLDIKCKHKNVEEVTYVLFYGKENIERAYKGFCCNCEHMVKSNDEGTGWEQIKY